MAQSSTIGSAETIPNTEKVLSMWRSFLRDVARVKGGQRSKVIEAMADTDIYIEGISERGKLLNLTGNEAIEYKVADFISNDYEEILAHFNIPYNSVVKVEEGMELKNCKGLIQPLYEYFTFNYRFCRYGNRNIYSGIWNWRDY